MGNRCYATIKDKNETITIYMHWNGSLDTWLPIVKTCFELKQKNKGNVTPSRLVEFLRSLGLRPEIQTDPEAQNYNEENGHYKINLDLYGLCVEYESGKTLIVNNFKREFENFLARCISPSYRDSVTVNYWHGLQTETCKWFLGVSS